MRKLVAGLIILLGLASPALAQRIQAPGNVAIGCAYNASPPTLTTSWFGYVQCDSTGKLIVSGGGGGGAVTQGTVPWVVSGQGTAGTAATGVVTVQGIASMTPFLTTTTLAAETTKVIGTVNQGTSPWVTSAAGAINTTPTDCSGTIAAGGAAQNAFTAAATRHGFTIANIDTSEVLWISFTTTAAAAGAGSYPLAPATVTTFANLSSFTSPLGLGINTALSVIATTTSHAYSCTVW